MSLFDVSTFRFKEKEQGDIFFAGMMYAPAKMIVHLAV
jgi:hypothetical protein